MFGASAVRKKRERERREKEARGSEPIIFPYIKVLKHLKTQLVLQKNELTLLLSDFVLTIMMVLDDLQSRLVSVSTERSCLTSNSAVSRNLAAVLTFFINLSRWGLSGFLG